VKKLRATTNPYSMSDRKMSNIYFPGWPIAAKAICEKEPPGTRSLAYNNFIRQKSVMKKEAPMQQSENSHPPFIQFFGIQRKPIATNPFKREKYVPQGPSFFTTCNSDSLIRFLWISVGRL
jgi:hypothetical protein